MKINSGTITFTSGLIVHVSYGTVSIDEHLELHGGNDHSIMPYVNGETRAQDRPWTAAELADHMIGLWTRFKEAE